MSFDDWFEQLLWLASDMPSVYTLIEKAPFMYEDYFDMGMTPADALYAEWGV